jgi:hypothetical protein
MDRRRRCATTLNGREIRVGSPRFCIVRIRLVRPWQRLHLVLAPALTHTPATRLAGQSGRARSAFPFQVNCAPMTLSQTAV